MNPRILLIYPPASQHEKGQESMAHREPDTFVVPYGLLTVASHLRQHGFRADVVNLSSFPWEEAIRAIRDRPAEMFGLSCHTFDRHAAAALGSEIKALYPQSHLTAGGPHVSALPREWLAHYPAFDSVVIGEGEATALELAECLRNGRPATGIAGTAYRADGPPRLGPPREPIADLDTLGKPWEHFDYMIPVTSRGCTGRCTFCCTPQMWGRKIRFRSAESILDELEHLVVTKGRHVLPIKDDTFVVNRKRLLGVCRGILQRELDVTWSCDARVDHVTAEMLTEMRRAGCWRVSFGVESGSPEILANIGKRTNLDQVAKATAAAKELGIEVRFYLIVGNRGETPETVRQTFELVERLQPTHCVVSCLLICPGTEEFEYAKQQGVVSTEEFFTDPSPHFHINRGEQSEAMNRILGDLFAKAKDANRHRRPYTLDDRRRVLARYPEMLLSYLDLAEWYCRGRQYDDALSVLESAATAVGRQVPRLLHFLACVHFARRDYRTAEQYFNRAVGVSPKSSVLRASAAALNAAGPMNPQQAARMTDTLLENLFAKTTFTVGQPGLPARLPSPSGAPLAGPHGPPASPSAASV